MDRTEDNKMIAEYHGYKLIKKERKHTITGEPIFDWEYYRPDGSRKTATPLEFWGTEDETRNKILDTESSFLYYHSSIEWLYPVARKLLEELNKTSYLDALIHFKAIKEAGSNFDTTELFNAVYEGITFLNQLKK